MDCVFCAITQGSSPAWRLYEDDGAVAFLDVAPARQGHTLVVPRTHVTDVMADGAEAALALMAMALHVVGRELVRVLDADGLSLFQSNGEAAGQEVLHLHVHLVPRRRGDVPLTVWERDPVEVQRLPETYALLRPDGSHRES